MNPHIPHPISLNSLFSSLWRNRQLTFRMMKREVVGRYKGSVIGMTWSLLNPLLLLMLYTFVFSVVFKARWGVDLPESKFYFAIFLFAGMIVHSLVAETLDRAPRLILNNVNYVKKIVFPLEILPVVAIAVSFFNALISVLVLVVSIVIISGGLQWTVLFLPLILFPLLVLTLGIAWGLASLGVFLRDIVHLIPLSMTILLFGSPVFYPVSAMPENIRPLLMLNPLTFIIQQTRSVLILGEIPNWNGLLIYYLVSVLIAWLGYAWFQKTRNGFANVL